MSGTLLRPLGLLNIYKTLGCQSIHTSIVSEAARKGTREKARKKKVKVELKKVGFIPHNLREDARSKTVSKRSIEEKVDEPLDEVFFTKYYKTVSYPVAKAAEFHREVNHPTVLNKPKADVNVIIELNMVAEKKTRFMDSFNRIVHLPHPFGTHEDRTVLAFCKTPELVEEAMAAGADLAGGPELVQKIQSGDLALNDFKFVVCHPNMMAELVPVRGLMRRKFPQAKSGTLGTDLKAMISKFKLGLQYRCEKNDNQHDLGIITAPIGNLEMAGEELEANFTALIKDVEDARPKRGGDFVTWVWCTSAPSPEKVKIDYVSYLQAAPSS